MTMWKPKHPRRQAVAQVALFAVFVFLAQLLFDDKSLLTDFVVTLVAAAIFTAIVLWDVRRRALSGGRTPFAPSQERPGRSAGWIDHAMNAKRYRIGAQPRSRRQAPSPTGRDDGVDR